MSVAEDLNLKLKGDLYIMHITHFQHPICGKENKLIFLDIRPINTVTDYYNTK